MTDLPKFWFRQTPKVAVTFAKIFGSLPPEAAKNYAYRSVTENIFGRSILGAVTTVTFGYLEGARDA